LVCAGAIFVHAIVFFIDWSVHPELINLTYYEYIEQYPDCYLSQSYNITKWYAVGLGLIIIIFTFLTKPKSDAFKIKREYFDLGIFWLAYLLISTEVTPNVEMTDTQILYYDIYLWMITAILFNSLFIIHPWLKYRSLEMNKKRVSMSMDLYSQDSPSANPNFFRKERMLELFEDLKFLKQFQAFLEKEYCAEPLLFWKCLKKYKSLFDENDNLNDEESKKSNIEEISPDEDLISDAHSIYESGKKIFELFLSKNKLSPPSSKPSNDTLRGVCEPTDPADAPAAEITA
jgi:hypothetical protein